MEIVRAIAKGQNKNVPGGIRILDLALTFYYLEEQSEPKLRISAGFGYVIH